LLKKRTCTVTSTKKTPGPWATKLSRLTRRPGKRAGDGSETGTSTGEDETDTCTKPFVEHLEDLRKTILWCAGLLAAGMLIAIPLAPRVLHLLIVPLSAVELALPIDHPEDLLTGTNLTEGLAIAMRICLWGGVLLALPGILVVVAGFVFPGLTSREKRAVKRGLGFASVLFAGGVCLGYLMTLPVAIDMMFRIYSWLGVSLKFIRLVDYVSFALRLLIAFGIAFELPVVVLILGALGIVNSTQLRNKRRHVVVGLLVLAMFLTPADPITMILMAAPLIVLYEFCIWLIWVRERRAARQD